MKSSRLIHYIVMGIALTSLASIFYYYSIKPIIERRALNSNKMIIEKALGFYRADFGVYPKSLDFLVGAPKTVLNDRQINISEWEYSAKDDGYSLTYLNSKL